jgi:hypothetical protein
VIRGVFVLSVVIGAASYMIADILRPDTGTTTRWPDSWPVQHAEWFGFLTGIGVFGIGLLLLIATNAQRSINTPPA